MIFLANEGLGGCLKFLRLFLLDNDNIWSWESWTTGTTVCWSEVVSKDLGCDGPVVFLIGTEEGAEDSDWDSDPESASELEADSESELESQLDSVLDSTLEDDGDDRAVGTCFWLTDSLPSVLVVRLISDFTPRLARELGSDGLVGGTSTRFLGFTESGFGIKPSWRRYDFRFLLRRFLALVWGLPWPGGMVGRDALGAPETGFWGTVESGKGLSVWAVSVDKTACRWWLVFGGFGFPDGFIESCSVPDRLRFLDTFPEGWRASIVLTLRSKQSEITKELKDRRCEKISVKAHSLDQISILYKSEPQTKGMVSLSCRYSGWTSNERTSKSLIQDGNWPHQSPSMDTGSRKQNLGRDDDINSKTVYQTMCKTELRTDLEIRDWDHQVSILVFLLTWELDRRWIAWMYE